MIRRLMVGKWFARAGVKRVKGSYLVVIMIPVGNKASAELCLEGLGKGEKIVERKGEESK